MSTVQYFLERPDWDFKRATDGASGFDLRCSNDADRELEPGVRFAFHTGLYLEMPIGLEAQVRSRSGLALNHGVIVLNAPGTVDSDYRGEILVTLINLGKTSHVIKTGDKIAQLVFAEVVLPHSGGSYVYLAATKTVRDREFSHFRVRERAALSQTARGDGGHGSTGR